MSQKLIYPHILSALLFFLGLDYAGLLTLNHDTAREIISNCEKARRVQQLTRLLLCESFTGEGLHPLCDFARRPINRNNLAAIFKSASYLRFVISQLAERKPARVIFNRCFKPSRFNRSSVINRNRTDNAIKSQDDVNFYKIAL
ncbi:hypothetical protein PUN28_000934 [Cardiocondyla obscurior]|uniref:Uncharacterized protein n=1 Tax=Cardiocondyla obscurior TaxID=286306 RepID=A0AAW2H1U9_9HYME